MKKDKQIDNDFNADEVIKPVVNRNKQLVELEAKKEMNTNSDNTDNNKYLKFYELNEDGLKLYGIYKKEQYLSTLKWSVLGTAFGVGMSIFFDVVFKRMDMKKKDVYKTFILFGSVIFCTYQGFNVSTSDFKKKQNVLVQYYGKEIHKS